MGDSETLVGSIGGVGGGGGGSIATATKNVGTVVKGTPLVVVTPNTATSAGRLHSGAHGLPAAPTQVHVYGENVVADNGYVPGDVVDLTGLTDGFVVRVDATHIYFSINRNGPYMAPKTGSATGGPRMNEDRWTYTIQPYLITEQSVVTRITGSTGHGLYLRNPADEFTGANLAACRTARDTYFNNAANADALLEFQENQSLAIILNPTNSTDNVFETYLPSTLGAAYDAAQWRDRTDAVQGKDGSQGRFEIIIHINATTAPAKPTGGSYDTATGVLSPPTGWTEAPTTPGTGEDVYASQAVIEPKTQSGTVTPVWSIPVERSHLSGGISHVETSTDFTGGGTPSDVLKLANPLTPNPSDTPTRSLLALKYGNTTYNVDEVIDVTTTGLPVLTEANHRSLFIDFDTPRVWIGHRVFNPRIDARGSFSDYSHSNYKGALSTNPSPIVVNDYFYNTARHSWYIGVVLYAVINAYEQTTIFRTLGNTAQWIGEQSSDTAAVNALGTHNNSYTYYYYNTTTSTVRVLDNATYVAPIDELTYYQAEPISAPGGIVNAITGFTAGAGLVGGGRSGVVSISIDVSKVDFPTIPIDKGGTGAVDVAAARTALAVLTQAQVDARAVLRFTAAEKTKLSGLSTGGGAAVNLGTVTLAADRLTAAAPSGYSRYPDGTLLLFRVGTNPDSSWTGNLEFYIGTDRYDLQESGTNSVSYPRNFLTDTSYLAVVHNAVQLIGPLEDVVRLSGATFKGATGGIAPVGNTDFVTKGYADANYSVGGFTLHTGAGVPASTLGSDKDWYLRTSNGAMYQKGSGAWSLIYTDQVGQAGTGITQSAANTLIQDALAAAVMGNTETGIAVTYNVDGTIDFVIQAPAQTHTNYVGITDGALSAVTASDFTVSGVAEALVIPAYSDTRRLLFARPASESDPTEIYLYQSGQRNTQNQIHIFDKGATTVQLGGEAHNWWGTVDLQRGFGGYMLEQVN